MIPSYFIAHGSPLLAVEENDYTKFLMQLGQQAPKPVRLMNIRRFMTLAGFQTLCFKLNILPEVISR